MQSYRALSRLPVTQATRVLVNPQARNMSLWPRTYFTEDPTSSFTPLFRLLDDFDNYSRSNQSNRHRSPLKSFNPKFDVKELPDSYELHGELPGIEQENVEIEFSEPQTLTIRGRSERSYESGNPSAGFVEGPKAADAITEGGETNDHKGHKATVEDEDAPKETAGELIQSEEKPQEKGQESKYWVSERSIGEFSRSFSFPARVDQDQVQASMKNGILSILVPKAKKHESRKITIS